MIKAEMISGRTVIRVHDEFIRRDVEAVLPQLDNIVSESYKRRQRMRRHDPQRTAQ